jgi:SnoaL-like domain
LLDVPCLKQCELELVTHLDRGVVPENIVLENFENRWFLEDRLSLAPMLARAAINALVRVKGGKPQEATFRVTDVFHKANGKWKVIQTHISAPMERKTGLTERI